MSENLDIRTNISLWLYVFNYMLRGTFMKVKFVLIKWDIMVFSKYKKLAKSVKFDKNQSRLQLYPSFTPHAQSLQ